jgi:hypothetical protein
MSISNMVYKIILGVFLFLTWIGNSCMIYAQVVEEWVARFNGFNGYGDRAYAIAKDSSGYLYVTGSSWIDTLEGDCATVKYDSIGNEIWVAWYDGQLGIGEDIGTKLYVDNSGYIYVIGESRGVGTDFDYFTIKYDNTGNEHWASRYNGLGDSTDTPTDIDVDNNGNVYVTGYSWGHPDSFSDFDWATVKYDSMGSELWVARYNGSGNYDDEAYALVVDLTENVYVTGRSAALSLVKKSTTIKYDSSGNEVWVVRNDSMWGGNDIVINSTGNVYVTGSSIRADILTSIYNSDGSEIGQLNYDSGINEGSSHILLDPSGNVIVAGGRSGGITNADYLTVKFDTTGNVLWAREWNGPANDDDIRTGLAVDPLGNVAVTGRTTIFGNDFKDDYATVKYDSSGNELWSAIYNGPADADDETYGVVMDASGNVYVTGYSDAGPPTGYDYTTIKYSDQTGIEENNIRIVKEPFSITPNPFWSVTTIQGRGEFKVYDLMGRLRGKVRKGAFGGNLPAGIYVIQQGEKKVKIVKVR